VLATVQLSRGPVSQMSMTDGVTLNALMRGAAAVTVSQIDATCTSGATPVKGAIPLKSHTRRRIQCSWNGS
jgi:hypothetical protein